MEGERASMLPKMSSARQTLLRGFERTLVALDEVQRAMNSGQAINERTVQTPEEESASAKLDERGEWLVARLHRIAGYLGESLNLPVPNALDAVKAIREGIQRGDSDDALALWLAGYSRGKLAIVHISPIRDYGELAEHLNELLLCSLFESSQRRRDHRRRAPIPDGLALRAHELHAAGMAWPKVADELCAQRERHAPHKWDSECTGRWKQSDQRLKRFLKELQCS